MCCNLIRQNSSLRLYFLLGSFVTSNEMNGMVAFTLMKSELKAEEKIVFWVTLLKLTGGIFFQQSITVESRDSWVIMV